MNYFIVAFLLFWAASVGVAQTSSDECSSQLFKVDLDADAYAKRASGFETGTLIVLDSVRSLFNIGHLDVFLIDNKGGIIRGLDYTKIDSIADLHAKQKHGASAKVKRTLTELDSVLCMRTVYYVRGLRRIEGQELARIELSVIVENVDVRYGYAFENAFFTVDVDYDLNICKSTLIEDSSVLAHSLSLVNGISTAKDLVLKTEEIDGLDSAQSIFVHFSLKNDKWIYNGPFTKLKYIEGPNYFTHFPGGIKHSEGFLYSNGKDALVQNVEGVDVLQWEVPDYRDFSIKKLISYDRGYIAISFPIGENRPPKGKPFYYYVEFRDQKLNQKTSIGRYDMKRFLVNDISLKGEGLHVLLFDKKSKNHVVHILNFKEGCDGKVYR